MNQFLEYYHSSIGKKQIVAVTGLLLILYVLIHLAGNLFMYAGPEVYNNYAKKLTNLRPGLYVLEFGLLLIFLFHLYTTAMVVLENIQARGKPYEMTRPVGEQSFSVRLMPWTGAIIFVFVVWHLMDFTFADHLGPRSVLPDGKSYGLFGVVYNAFLDPMHSSFYLLAMLAVGLHLSHGIQSTFQTFGYNHPVYTPLIERSSDILALLVTFGYSSIPVSVLCGIIKF